MEDVSGQQQGCRSRVGDFHDGARVRHQDGRTGSILCCNSYGVFVNWDGEDHPTSQFTHDFLNQNHDILEMIL